MTGFNASLYAGVYKVDEETKEKYIDIVKLKFNQTYGTLSGLPLNLTHVIDENSPLHPLVKQHAHGEFRLDHSALAVIRLEAKWDAEYGGRQQVFQRMWTETRYVIVEADSQGRPPRWESTVIYHMSDWLNSEGATPIMVDRRRLDAWR